MENREFENMAKRVRPTLLSMAEKMLHDGDEAEDTVQDVLLKLWLIRDRLDLYHSVDALAVAVTKNLCISRLRTRQTSLTVPMDEGMETADNHTPDLPMEERETHAWLVRTVRGLPAGQFAILRMSQTEGMSNRQIAEVLGITETSVRTALCKARHKLLEKLRSS